MSSSSSLPSLRPSSSSLYDFATWEPLLRLLRADHVQALAAPGGEVAGLIGRQGWSVPVRMRFPEAGRAMLVSDNQEAHDAIDRVRAALTEAGIGDVAFAAEIPPSGKAVLHLFDHGPAVDPGIGNAHPGALTLVEGAVPEPWRRLPEPVPGARPAPSVDLEVLTLGGWRGEPVSLNPLVGLPRLRTLYAGPGALTDPREVARLTGLEFLELTPEDWRCLLDAGAVPRGLSAAAIEAPSDHDLRPIMALANELLTLWERPLITETVIEGDLGPLP